MKEVVVARNIYFFNRHFDAPEGLLRQKATVIADGPDAAAAILRDYIASLHDNHADLAPAYDPTSLRWDDVREVSTEAPPQVLELLIT
jgi:hypothetical protein